MTIKITVDGKVMESPGNETVFEVAKRNGIWIPTLCHMSLIPGNKSGACRMCLVEVTGGGRPGLQSSCTLPATDGLIVSTTSAAVYDARRMVVELLLTEHKQDCTNCPTSGDCVFSKMSREYDLNGVSVCAECPNQKDGCLLSRGVLCMGPITHANCNAYCTRKGYRCEGCHGTLVNEDVLGWALDTYAKKGFKPNDILDGAKVYSARGHEALKKAMIKKGMIKGGQ